MKKYARIIILVTFLVTSLHLVNALQYYSLDLLLQEDALYLINSSFVNNEQFEDSFLDHQFTVHTKIANGNIKYTGYFLFPETKTSTDFIIGDDYFLPVQKITLPRTARTKVTVPLHGEETAIVIVNPSKTKSWVFNISQLASPSQQASSSDALKQTKRTAYTTISTFSISLLVISLLLLFLVSFVSFSRRLGIKFIAAVLIFTLATPTILFYNIEYTLQDADFYKEQIHYNLKDGELTKNEIDFTVDTYMSYLKKQQNERYIDTNTRMRINYIKSLLQINSSIFFSTLFLIVLCIFFLFLQKEPKILMFSLLLSTFYSLSVVGVVFLLKRVFVLDILAILFPFDTFSPTGIVPLMVQAGLHQVLVGTLVTSLALLLTTVLILLGRKYYWKTKNR